MHHNQRLAGLLGMAAPFWFIGSYFLVSSLRSDYRHFNMAISELGSAGAPNALLWNLLGYIIPGAAIAYLGWASRALLPASRSGTVVAWSLALSGLMMSFSGVFPGDFEDRTSASMLLHTAASILGYVFFLVSAFVLARISAKSEAFSGLHYPLLAAAALSIVTGFIRYGDLPGLGQRITFLCYFAWVALYAWSAFRSGKAGAQPTAW